MTPGEFRSAFETFRDEVSREAVASKSSHDAFVQLSGLYTKFDADECALADAIIADWLGSDDESKRWDAEALIQEHTMASALPQLRALADELECATDPGAPYERAKVNRIIGQLAERGQRG
jgi:hypothetical protein